MKRATLVCVVASWCCNAGDLGAESAPREIVAVSLSGALEVESVPPAASSGNDDASPDLWVVSTTDRSQRARLPKQSPESPTDDEFHFSPNEEWLFGLRHVGSGLRYANIYHLVKPLRIEVVGNEGHFNEFVWEKAVKLGALKRNAAADGDYAMTFFGGWSLDSGRLLINLCGGIKKSDMRCAYFYFNTRTNDFEVTDYSRKLSGMKSTALTCAEPLDPLPPEAELKKRLDSLDRQLNAKYAEVLAKTAADRASVVRRAQRDWLKQRDAGEKFYVSLFPAPEKPRRRLQFLADVTAARIEMPPEQWE
jgi:uncharacterized protein YecT (DUF1311 family)